MDKKRSIVFILDCSFSSDLYLKKYIDIVNQTVQTAKKLDSSTLVSVISFNTKYDFCYFMIPANQFPVITSENSRLKPVGTTALYDCLGAILVHLEKFFKKTDRFPREDIDGSKPVVDEPLIIILTDGDDNSSKVLGPRHLFFQISKLRNRHWKFVFFGTTQESINFGKIMAFNTNFLYNYSCTTSIISVIEKLLENDKILKTGQILESDLRELETSLEKMSI